MRLRKRDLEQIRHRLATTGSLHRVRAMLELLMPRI
jgi:hypothetical protein